MVDFDWSYVWSLFSYKDFWEATLLVVWLSVLTWVVSTVLGFFVALAKDSKRWFLRTLASIYVWFFRSLPLMVLLIFVYNLPQLLPSMGVLLSEPFWAGLIAMVLSETAYIAEIHRGGLLSIPKGQHEAARALGIRFGGRQRLIVLPQALRVALPSLANEFVTIAKLTSLVSVISLAEILLVGQRLYTRNFKVIETMLAVAAYYVFIVSVFSYLVSHLERWLDVTKRNPGEMEKMPIAGESTVNGPAIANGSVPVVLTKTGWQGTDRRKRPRSAPPDRPVVAVEGVSKSFGRKCVLDNVSVSVGPSEVLSIIGPSGSGKTTLIRTINALQDIDGGCIRLDGDVWIDARHGYILSEQFHQQVTHVGMVFQNFNLFPHKTILENVMLAPCYHTLGNDDELRARALTVLEKVDMKVHAMKFPHQLSGGQQQRVAIARALAMQPRVMLFDEPTSALDPELVSEVLRVIEMLAKEGMTMIIVTHEMRFALSVSDRMVMMEAGRVVANGTPDELLAAPAGTRIANFLAQSRY
ncbi:MAG: amino acid ABC transporter permease/ATP-binding protein [Gammaproteobacteria bacterium]|nr:amino acid ABC transporter permease/ATP-binding protein [Gammaproteobacteria bacterium]